MKDLIASVVSCLICLAVGVFLGWQDGNREGEFRAIRAGVAEQVITNRVTGKTEFRWIECPCGACVARRELVAEEKR